MAMTTTACDDGEGHGEKARRDDNGGRGAITTAHSATTTTTTTTTAYTDDDDDDAQWHATQWRTARTMTSSPHQANRQRPPLPAQYRRSL